MPTQIATALPVLHAVLFAATTKKPAGASSVFVFLLLLLAVGAFLYIRPQRRRQRDLATQQRAISVGDEVITAAGIVGRVQSMSDDRVRIEVAPGTTIEIVRRAIGQRVIPPPAAWGGPSSGQWDFPSSPNGPGHGEPPTGNQGGSA